MENIFKYLAEINVYGKQIDFMFQCGCQVSLHKVQGRIWVKCKEHTKQIKLENYIKAFIETLQEFDPDFELAGIESWIKAEGLE